MGRTGSGKTTLLRQLLVTRLKALADRSVFPPVFIHDTRLRRGSGWNEECIGALAPKESRFSNLSEFYAAKPNGHLKHQFSAFCECEPDELFRLAWARKRHYLPSIVVIDELAMLPHTLVREKHFAYACLTFGRPYPIDVLGTTQQPQEISPLWFSQASHVRLFQLYWDRGLDRIARSRWPSAERLAEKVPTLKPFEYISVEV